MTRTTIGRIAACCTALALAAAAYAQSPDIVISQVYGGGGNTGAPYRNDFIELFNRGNAAVDITGWSVQYASTSGTTWQVTALSGSIAPGQYYLVQEAGGANGVALPTPDATGTIAMAAANGKVALVNNGTMLAGSCPSVYDFVGYGTANCFEGAAAAGALSNTTAALRNTGGCDDTNQNGADFTVAAPNPRNSASATNPCNVPTGACCTAGVCSIARETDCTGGGGTYQGDGTNCDGDPCGPPPITGACCIAGACQVLSAADCGSAGGSYLGDDSSCANPNPCIACVNAAGARAAGTNVTIHLCDVVVSSTTDLISSATSKNFQVQDASGAITVFGSNAAVDAVLAQAALGDQIDIEGVTATFNGLFELGVPFFVLSNEGNVGPPAAQPIVASDLADAGPGESYESEIVTLGCVLFTNITPGQLFAANTNYTVVDATGTAVVRIATPELDLVGWPIPTNQVSITGIVTQNDNSDPRDGGYQLLPRGQADFNLAPENCPAIGACCRANGFCVQTTEANCTFVSGTYQGDNSVCEVGLCPGPTGACCFASGACQEVSEGDCAALAGTFQGVGTTCTPNPCPQPTGACCMPGGACVADQTQADCAGAGGNWLGMNTTCGAASCPQPVQGGDIALALDQTITTNTTRHIRAGASIGRWNAQAVPLQAMEFDNAFDTLHAACGNLLALRFGTALSVPPQAGEGGALYSLATNGDDAAQLLYTFDSFAGGIESTRVGGLGVSPDNAHASVIGFDTGSLIVLDYNAGGAIGTGTGASVTGAASSTFFTAPGVTQGTTWYDGDTILAYISDPFGAPGTTKLYSIDYSGGVFGAPTERTTIFITGAGSRFMDVEYNPDLSPYVFCMYSSFEAAGSPPTKNTLTVVNSADWSQVAQITLNTSLQTSREIALGPDRNLYLGQFAGSGLTTRIYLDRLDLDTDDDGDTDAVDIAALTNDSSVDYYSETPGDSASFSGFDVAFECDLDPCAGSVKGDANCDGVVDNGDVDCFVAALLSVGNPEAWRACALATNPNCAADYVCTLDMNGDTLIDNGDVDGFVDCLIHLPPPGQNCPILP